MARLRPRETPSFTRLEIEQMEKLFEEVGEETLNQNFCKKLARKFSRDIGRSGKPSIQWKEVQNWFLNKQQACTDKITSSPIAPKEVVAPPDTFISNGPPESSSVIPKDEKLPDLSDLEFEARSSKDGAWYDVAIFLTHRVVSSGEPEVRVRFVGFGAEEDEWVNVKKAVRERSLPMEPSECQRVKVGDLVLCFQERRDQAIYYDAHVLEIQRRLHDIRGCRCLFLVRYDHDNTEEKVRLRRLCRRPSF